MCGIAGYIGSSKEPDITFNLITKLFEKIELRGKDAAGFWGTQAGNGKILYHKEPGRPTNFVEKDVWKNVRSLNPNLLLVHAREASQGVGSPTINKNNHPFVSEDLQVGLVHNGRIPDNIYQALNRKYECLSACDSEILLRIFLAGHPDGTVFSDEKPDMASKLMGVRDIWSTVSKGHMAVAIGEHIADQRRLWLFRNKHRTLWIVDLRDALGQVFFVSTKQIWDDAVYECKMVRDFLAEHKVKLNLLPEEEVWVLEISDKSPVVEEHQLQKFRVESAGEFGPWEYDGNKIAAKPPVFNENIYTFLTENDNLESDLSPINNFCNDILNSIEYIRNEHKNNLSFSNLASNRLLKTLHRTKLDLDAAIRFMDMER